MAHAPELTTERVARESYGRLVAILAARSRDVAAAEDALGDAFAEALSAWPRSGVPNNPEAWLLTVARRHLLDGWRHDAVRGGARQTLLLILDESETARVDTTFPDERLSLMFACAHPAIDAAVRTPLMLQTVLGIDVARMAGAFVVAPATLSQRLVRAKQKIRDAGIPFEVPGSEDLPDRLEYVLDAVYAAYGTGWDEIDGTDSGRTSLSTEALHLAEALIALLPEEAEATGLLALMRFCEARVRARRDDAGHYVPLADQDITRWDRTQIESAESLLRRAARRRRLGPYQLEAAIQSAHCQKKLGIAVPPEALLALYDGLVTLRPRLGALVSRACALETLHGPAAALATLDEIPPGLVEDYQPYWAARAHLLAGNGDTTAAVSAYDRASALAVSASVKEHLQRKRAEVGHSR